MKGFQKLVVYCCIFVYFSDQKENLKDVGVFQN